MANEMLGSRQEAPALGYSGAQADLDRVRQLIVFLADLAVELDQLVGELLGNAGAEILPRKSLGRVGTIGFPDIDRQIGKTGIDVDRRIGKEQMVLRLLDRTARIVDLDPRLA